MSRAGASALALVALLAPLVATANVPDPTWIAGLYDGGDADEILLLVWDGAPALVAAAPAFLQLGTIALDPPPDVAPVSRAAVRVTGSRAPPLR